jgi:hypothetical protein
MSSSPVSSHNAGSAISTIRPLLNRDLGYLLEK